MNQVAAQPPIATNPGGFIMATSETWPLGFDTTNLLINDEVPSLPVSTLTDLFTGETVTLEDEPYIIGNVVTQVVRGSQLTAKHQYSLAVGFTLDAVTIPVMVLTINVPQ